MAAAQQEGGSSPLHLSSPNCAFLTSAVCAYALQEARVAVQKCQYPNAEDEGMFPTLGPRSSDLRRALCYVLINTQELKSAVNAPGEVCNAVCGSGLTA